MLFHATIITENGSGCYPDLALKVAQMPVFFYNRAMETIQTGRLILRNFQIEDAEALRELILQKEASPYADYDFRWPTTLSEVRDVAAWFARGDSYLAVCLKESGRLIGFIALNGPEGEPEFVFDLGYAFNFNYHGRGYATEACAAALRHAFIDRGAARVTSGTAALNEPSWRLLERLGLRKVGEGPASLRKTPSGEPVEFTGWAFEITRAEWLRASG